MKDLFNKEKIIYKNIEIPEDLDFLVIKSINEGKKRNNRVGLISKIVVATFITIFITLNLFPKFSIVAQNLPIIGKVAEFLTIDKGFSNAVEAGLFQNIGYENEINGIKLKVSNIVGDYKAMWIEYEISEGYAANVKLMDINEENEIRAFYTYRTEAYGKSVNYIKVNFEKFEQEFLLIFNVYNIDESEKLSVFKVPIKLEDKFNNNLKEITINNNLIKIENVEEIDFAMKASKYSVKGKEIHGTEVGGNLYRINEIITSFDILDEEKGIMEIEIESIVKDKINGFEFKINK